MTRNFSQNVLCEFPEGIWNFHYAPKRCRKVDDVAACISRGSSSDLIDSNEECRRLLFTVFRLYPSLVARASGNGAREYVRALSMSIDPPSLNDVVSNNPRMSLWTATSLVLLPTVTLTFLLLR